MTFPLHCLRIQHNEEQAHQLPRFTKLILEQSYQIELFCF